MIQTVLTFLRSPYTAPWDDPGRFLVEAALTLGVGFVVAAIAVEFGCFRHGEND
jgi:hypothetical protein